MTERATHEPDLSPDVASRRKGLRTGWTTGCCTAAAAKAAATGLLTGTVPEQIEIGLPAGTRVTFPVRNGATGTSVDGRPYGKAVVVKDAGDDPDCTNGAELTVEVMALDLRPASSGKPPPRATHFTSGAVADSLLQAGPGVGTITKPGLGLPVGAPAINKVPRRMILAALAEVTDKALEVTVSVPNGEQMATKTSNERLGILGGISILGTTGIVKPFSTAAYRASVVQQVDVAGAQGETTMVLCTGSRSEDAAIGLFPGLDPVSFVEVGDFSGIALRRCAGVGMTKVVVVAMVGKIAKLAAGVMMTHFHRSKVDTGLLARVALESGAPDQVVQAATATATARHFYEACEAAGTSSPLYRLCELAKDNCRAHAGDTFSCEVIMVDFDGIKVVARA